MRFNFKKWLKDGWNIKEQLDNYLGGVIDDYKCDNNKHNLKITNKERKEIIEMVLSNDDLLNEVGDLFYEDLQSCFEEYMKNRKGGK